MRYELQARPRNETADHDWRSVERGSGLSRLRRERQVLERNVFNEGYEYRIVEVVPDAVDPATPTIEEKHAAELEALAAKEKRWAKRLKLATTKLKKIRARKRRLERLYAPREEPS